MLSSLIRRHIVIGAAGSFALQIVFAGLSFLNAIILARVLGVEGYGVFANAMSWVTLLTIFATSGFGALLVREVAFCKLEKKWGLLKGILKFSDLFVLAVSLIIALIAGVAAGFFFPLSVQTEMRYTVWTALLLLPVMALCTLRESALRGLEHVIYARFPGMVTRPLLLLLGIIVIYYVSFHQLMPSEAMAINVGTGCIAFALGAFFLQKFLPIECYHAKAEYTPRLWLLPAFSMLLYGGGQVLIGQTDIFMLGLMSGAEEVGLYAPASRISFLLTYVTMASNMIMAPIIFRLYSQKEIKRLQILLRKSVRIAFIVSLPLGLINIFFGKNLLAVFGDQFSEAYFSLLILTLGRLGEVFLGVGTGGLVITAAGKEKSIAYIFLCAALVNVFLNMVLIPKYGSAGAAISSVISLLTARFFVVVIAEFHTKINVSCFARNIPFWRCATLKRQ